MSIFFCLINNLFFLGPIPGTSSRAEVKVRLLCTFWKYATANRCASKRLCPSWDWKSPKRIAWRRSRRRKWSPARTCCTYHWPSWWNFQIYNRPASRTWYCYGQTRICHRPWCGNQHGRFGLARRAFTESPFCGKYKLAYWSTIRVVRGNCTNTL